MVSVQMLRDSDLFGELSDEKLEQIARLCREEVYSGAFQLQTGISNPRLQ